MGNYNPLHIFLAGLAILVILLNERVRQIATLIILILVVIAGVQVFMPSAGRLGAPNVVSAR